MEPAPLVERLKQRSPRPLPSSRSVNSNLDDIAALEIVVPDRHRATLLAAYVTAGYTAEILSGSGSDYVVRLRPTSPERGRWVVDLLALVESWWRLLGRPVVQTNATQPRVRSATPVYTLAATRARP